jgi:2-dehydro-3-deoxygalactonokinase
MALSGSSGLAVLASWRFLLFPSAASGHGGTIATVALVAIDWGSTRFRAYRVEAGAVVDRMETAHGVLTTPPAALAGALAEALEPWRAWIERGRVPLRMAGMIGSNRGLRDAGYQRVPIDLDALASDEARVEVATPLATSATIRKGLALADGEAFDVMRGEEVQLLGAHRLRPADLYVFPGTHSKWVPVEETAGRARVRTFSTMMTGELYAWLVEGSAICKGVPETPAWSDEAFARGVERASRGGDVIEELFRTRARWLLGDLAPAAAPSFLSGLLIGHEVATMTKRYRAGGPLVVVGAERLCGLYVTALRQLALEAAVVPDDAAIVEGMGRVNDDV